MSISVAGKRVDVPEPVGARVTRDTLSVDLSDGRTISAPTQWFPRLFHGTPAEWAKYELSYEGIHWPELNEDIAVESLLRGEKSGESSKSLRRWLAYRARGRKQPVPELPLPPKLAKELTAIGVWPAKKQKPEKSSPRRKAG